MDAKRGQVFMSGMRSQNAVQLPEQKHAVAAVVNFKFTFQSAVKAPIMFDVPHVLDESVHRTAFV